MSKLPVPTAKEINDAHQFARDHAETAVDWAVKCGGMLARKKAELGHGKFMEWVTTYCKFAQSTANRYMKAAKDQISTGVEISTLSQIYPATPKPKPALAKEPLTGAKAEAGVGAEPAPAEPVASASTNSPPSAAGRDKTESSNTTEGTGPATAAADEPEWTAADEAQYQQEEETDSQERIAKAMAADDRLAEAFAQIKLQAHEIMVLKQSRDHYQRQAGEAVRLLKAEQRKVVALERKQKRAA